MLEDVEDQPGVMASLDRTVPVLKDHTLPAGTSVQQWAAQRALDPARIARLNPALAGGGRASSGTTRVLAPVSAANATVADTASALVASAAPVATAAPTPQVAKTVAAIADRPRSRRHTVRDGESAWTIARRYGMPVLLSLNGLSGSSVPGRAVLRVEDDA